MDLKQPQCPEIPPDFLNFEVAAIRRRDDSREECVVNLIEAEPAIPITIIRLYFYIQLLLNLSAMKKSISLFAIFAISVFSFTACDKKDVLHVQDLKLLKIESIGGTGTSTINFQYNSAGKIVKVTSSGTDAPNTTTIFDVVYSGADIILIRPPVSSTNTELSDSIYLKVDANGKLSRRIEAVFFEVTLSPNHQRSFTVDTTWYQYDAANHLTKEIRSYHDSTWVDNGTIHTSNMIINGVKDYIINGDNLASINYSDTTKSKGPPNFTDYQTVWTSTTTRTFIYGTQNPFKADFSNAAVLNELDVFARVPIIGSFAMLPTRSDFSASQRDTNGAVFSSENSSREDQFTYSFTRLVSTNTSSMNPTATQRYIYGKP